MCRHSGRSVAETRNPVLYIQAVTGLFAALTLRAALRAFNALRAFVRPSPEWRKLN